MDSEKSKRWAVTGGAFLLSIVLLFLAFPPVDAGPLILVAFVREIVLSRATLQLENIALRQQVAVLKRGRPRPWLGPLDRVFWLFLSRLWPRWKDALVIVYCRSGRQS